MTRNELIEAIMLQVDQVKELDAKDRAAVLWRLQLSHSAVLREIYSTNGVERAIARAYAIAPSAKTVRSGRESSVLSG